MSRGATTWSVARFLSTSAWAAVLGRVRDQGKTIFVVTHQVALMEQVADEFVQMSAGKIDARENVRPLPISASSGAGGER